MKNKVKIFSSAEELAEAFAEEMIKMISESASSEKRFTIALSGGTSPKLLFSLLGSKYSDSVSWQNVHFFWGDERCVPPEHPESNYGMTKEALLNNIEISEFNIHRIKGEGDPEKEAVRYSREIRKFTEERNGFPVFDLVLLGMGDDGHIASIFPGNLELFVTDKVCCEAIHPVTGQKRVTITGKVINNASLVVLMVTGEKKAKVVESLFKKYNSSSSFPASFVSPINGIAHWYIDESAGRLLD